VPLFTLEFRSVWVCAQPNNYTAATPIHWFHVTHSYKF